MYCLVVYSFVMDGSVVTANDVFSSKTWPVSFRYMPKIKGRIVDDIKKRHGVHKSPDEVVILNIIPMEDPANA